MMENLITTQKMSFGCVQLIILYVKFQEKQMIVILVFILNDNAINRAKRLTIFLIVNDHLYWAMT